MQLASIEIARNILNIEDAVSSEFTQEGTKVIALMPEWNKNGKSYAYNEEDDLGGTMRLGSFPCKLLPGTLAYSIYQDDIIYERHRHRWEFNINYKDTFMKSGVIFSGMSPENDLTEIIEMPNHPWFLGVQFHPEFKSRPFSPHPLFVSFVSAAIDQL